MIREIGLLLKLCPCLFACSDLIVCRYYAILHPMRAKYGCTLQRTRRVILWLWILAFTLATPIIFGRVSYTCYQYRIARRSHEGVSGYELISEIEYNEGKYVSIKCRHSWILINSCLLNRTCWVIEYCCSHPLPGSFSTIRTVTNITSTNTITYLALSARDHPICRPYNM